MFVPDSATDFFNELSEAVACDDVRTAYNDFHRTFTRFINQQTSFTSIELVGTFAKTDYLLKEHDAPYELVRAVNDTRVRLRKFKEGRLSSNDLSKYVKHDYQTICLLIANTLNVPPPDNCRKLFPVGMLESGNRTLLDKNDEYKRMIVSRWDDTFVYGVLDSESAEEVMVCYARGNEIYNYDWSYIKDLLYANAQINLIRPRIENSIIYPELIIFEPNYLVDISSIAACFEDYATTPYINLLSKIKANEATEHTLLGNIADKILDEELKDPTQTYGDIALKFYKEHALDLATSDISTQELHKNAMAQRANIRNAISKSLPEAVGRYDKKEVIVEPSFFSEMLGLQGRMDFFQLDHRVLIEHKSGKCGFPPIDPNTPTWKIKHYVQLLLYMALLRYNYREQYEKNNRQLHAFLMYSKYKNSLLGLGFAPKLLFEALKMRNCIARNEIEYANGGLSILLSLTPEKINANKTNGTLWVKYIKPQIEELIAPIHNASDLERAYYLRFLTFVEKEHLLSKLGNRTKESSGFAAKWLDTLDDKIQAGKIYSAMTLVSPKAGHQGEVDSIILRLDPTQETATTSFRKGDIVILYPYEAGEMPDARKTMVFRCTIVDIQVETITLRLRAQQSDANVFTRNSDMKWAVEDDFFESSDKALYSGLHAFLSAPQERKDLLLLQREPRTDTSKRLLGNYGSFNDLALRVKQACDMFLIIGPPGTGKTSFGLVNTLKEELLEQDTSVLLLSYTNRAIDEICSKLVEEGIDFIRIGSKDSCADDYHPYLLENKVEECRNVQALKDVISSTRVFVCTTAKLNANISLFNIKQFSLAIIDEASQILEPHLAGILGAQHYGNHAIKKIVMIGDHKQLPAVVQQTAEESKVRDPQLNDILLTDCAISLFERLLKRYGNDPSVSYMLTRQGRMHPEIADFPNQAFYEGKLKAVPLPHQQEFLASRISFINTKPLQASNSDKVNQSEADIIAAAVVRIYEDNKNTFDASSTIGVIVPYRNQIAAIRNTIDNYNIPILHDITIDTVERYQGSQRDYIIYGFTIKKKYQLNFLTENTFEENGNIIDRKLNVAMTRARKSLTLVGNASLLSLNPVFHKLIEYLKAKNVCL